MVFVASPVFAQADAATADTTTEHSMKKPDSAGHQLCIGIDLVSPVRNAFYTDRHGYEGEADYYLRNEFYLAAEAGSGGSKVDYPDLKYTTTNTFFRAGFNKTILARESKTDWDMMFFGLRAAYTQVTRSAASFTVLDSMWGNTTGSRPDTHFGVIWAELTGGMRVELLKGLFAGWNLRGKFIMNGKSFQKDAPLYIAGYGKGDKNSSFDFNLYISYGFRWARKFKAASVGIK
jgi:Domain of unknown function (DUF6048)